MIILPLPSYAARGRPLGYAMLLGALATALAGCGSGQQAATRLRVEVQDGGGVRAYSLRCDPAGGTVPEPAHACSTLRTTPGLLVGGRALEHSCPGQRGKIYRVSGRYLGHPVDATVSSDACGFVPGQGDAWGEWTILMAQAGPGSREPMLGSPPVDGGKRRVLLRRARGLQRALRRLTESRSKALAAGTLRLVSGRPPDAVARTIMRDQLLVQSLPYGPFPGEVRVYSTMRHHEPVYVVVVRYAYRDYAGRKHLDTTALASTLEARTLETTDVAWGAPWSPPGLGRPIVLDLS